MTAGNATDPRAGWSWPIPGTRGQRWLRCTAAWICLLVMVLLLTGCRRPPLKPTAPTALLEATAAAGRLQEVAPPQAVRQLEEALSQHHPRVKILAPAPEGLLGSGTWTVRVSVADWPLTDAGRLGLGAHLVLQIDDQPPIRLAALSPDGEGAGATVELTAELPELAPGSHRITAYAARPWGEAVKSPAAHDQIRVHRVAANPLALPAPGSPQLIPVSPAGLSTTPPVLIDWLLLDAPLQGLREGDGSWRLRITVNGDSFLVDQQVPLWLKGWRSGSNSVLIELVDGRGEPLNPPFNTLVREVTITPSGPAPVWQRNALSQEDLAMLLGQSPVPDESEDIPSEEPDDDTSSPASPGSLASLIQNEAAEGDPVEEPLDGGAVTAPEPLQGEEGLIEDQPLGEQSPEEQQDEVQPEPPHKADAIGDPAVTPPADSRGDTTSAEQADAAPEAPEAFPSPQTDSSERLSPKSKLEGSARESVREDGSLIRPRARGPLAGLRERFTP